MSEWWTYRLSNFLLFSPRTYYRLFELYNAAIWPAQVAAVLAGIAVLDCLLRPTPARARVAAAILSVSWAWVAIAFLAKRYATINWAALQFAWAFGAQAALLAWAGVTRGSLVAPRKGNDGAGGTRLSPAIRWSNPGAWMLLYALFLHPLAGLAVGREWRGAEIFGVAPDPTAIATLGAVLGASTRPRLYLLAIPILWCVMSGATLLAMKDPRCWVLFVAGAFSVFAAFRKRRPDRAAALESSPRP